jgi:hypothetical protein
MYMHSNIYVYVYIYVRVFIIKKKSAFEAAI